MVDAEVPRPFRSHVHTHLEHLDLAYAPASLSGRALEGTERALRAFAHLTPPDRARLAIRGAGPNLPPRHGCIHHAFLAHAAARPDALALEHGPATLTYGALAHTARALAGTLRARGVRAGQRVVLLARRGVSMVVGVLAVLMASAAYVPLDGGVVTDVALAHVLGDASTTLVLACDAFLGRVPGEVEVMSLDAFVRGRQGLGEQEVVEVADESRPEDVAYVIYTSGTTGTPKGVSVRHSSLTNLLCLSPGRLTMRPGVRVAQLMNIAFDMAAWEILGALANGAALVLRGSTRADWCAVLRSADVVIATPSILAQYDPREFGNVQCVAVAGEPCPQKVADTWAQSARFYDCCGPTEITIVNTVHHHTPGDSVSIGTPTPNNRVYILDEHMRPVPFGVPGTMWASGAGTAAGYVNLPALTGRRFVRDPFRDDGSMMFNTGDLGRWTSAGVLEHLGRVDDQVKVKGFRVELDGVAHAMQAAPGVVRASAHLLDGRLVGFACPSTVDIDLLRKKAESVLPYYAVPTQFVLMDTMPLTSNGKIDKASLCTAAMRREPIVPCVSSTETSTQFAPTKPEAEYALRNSDPEGALPKSRVKNPLSQSRGGQASLGFLSRLFNFLLVEPRRSDVLRSLT